MNDKKNCSQEIAISLVSGVILTVLLRVYMAMGPTQDLGSNFLKIHYLVSAVVKHPFIYVAWPFASAVIFLIFHYKAIGSFVYRFRFAIAGALFVLCVVLGVSGSNIGAWCSLLNCKDSGLILGASRKIRSDEWAVSFPMNISQIYGGNDAFSYFSDSINGYVTDYGMGYRQPVLSLITLFRPFTAGFLFLPAASAISFYWMGKLFALMLVSFEFFMLVTEKRKGLSFAGMLITAFAPAASWWFAATLPDLMIYSMLSIILFRKYLSCGSTAKRLLFLLGISLCAGSFIMVLYPSWQVPFAYILLALIIWTIIDCPDKKRMKISDIGFCVLMFGMVFAALFLYMKKSSQAVELTMNTVYPGERFEVGGNMGKGLFSGCTNLWFALTELSHGTNVCEEALFIDMFPLGIIVAFIVLFRDKKKDSLLILMLVLNLFLGIWCAVGFPKALAGITFLKMSQSSRTIVAFSLCNVIMLIRGIALMKKPVKVQGAILIAAFTGVCQAGISYMTYRDYYTEKIGSAFTLCMFAAAFAVIVVAAFFTLFYKNGQLRKVFFAGIGILAFVSGILVNPVRIGIGSIENSELVRDIDNIKKTDSDAVWAVVNSDFPYPNMPLLAGVKTISATNVYPNMEAWHKLDEDGQYDYVYNRYAHVNIVYEQDVNPYFEIGVTRDQIVLHADANDLKLLGVKYIVTVDNQKVQIMDEKLEKLSEGEKYIIYRLK